MRLRAFVFRRQTTMDILYAIEESIKIIDISGNILTETVRLFRDREHKIIVFKTKEDAKIFLNQRIAALIDGKLAEFNAVLYRIDHLRNERYMYKLSFSTNNEDRQNESIIWTLSTAPIRPKKGDHNV